MTPATMFRKICAFVDGASRLHIGLLFIPMLAVAILEMASIGMVLPITQILLGQGDAPTARLLDRLIPAASPEQRALVVAGVFTVLFVSKNISLFAMIFLINRTIQMKSALFLKKMFVMYLDRPLQFHLRRNSAEIIRNLNTSANRAFESIRIMMMMALEGMLALVAFGLLVAFEPALTLIASGGLIGFGLLYHRFAGPYFQRWGANAQTLEGSLIKSISEALGSIRHVKLLHLQKFLGERFLSLTSALARNYSNLTSFQHAPRLLVETLIVLGFAVFVLTLFFSRQRLEDVMATLGLFGMAALRLMPSVNRILSGATDLRNRLPSIDVLFDDIEAACQESARTRRNEEAITIHFERRVELRNVSFSYAGGTIPAIRNVSFDIAFGSSLGIVGLSGAGKSTLIDLFLGLLTPNDGTILVDGIDISDAIKSWQDKIGYVPQQIFLVDDTVRRNIAFGIEEDHIDDIRVAAAIEAANLRAVIDGLPLGLETHLGEVGSRLSGGQRQRVAIARALYRDPPILVFDEATSDLDNETEKEVTLAINRLRGRKTIVTVTHKIAIARNCDMIVMMRDGAVDGVGSFTDLACGSAAFRGLVAAAEPRLLDEIKPVQAG